MAMDSESYWIYERMRLYELLEAHPEWSLRQYARTLQHDARWVRKWRRRIQEAAPVRVTTFFSQSRAPHHPPQRVSEAAKQVVVELRHELSERFHRKAGAKTIQYGFEQRQQKGQASIAIPRSGNTITRILHEAGEILPPAPVRHEPLVLPPPLEEWELDFGEIRVEYGYRFEFLVVIDRGTSRLMYLEGSEGYQAESVLLSLQRLFAQNGLPKRLRFDRDPRLWGSWTRDSYPSPWVRVLRAVGVEPVICPPHRPDLKPFVERCIGTLKHEWLARFSLDALGAAFDALDSFSPYYNDQRPHQGRACQNRTPREAFPNLPVLPTLPLEVDPDTWLQAEHGRLYRRRVNAAGTIQIDRHLYSIGSRWAHQPVLVQLDAHERCFRVFWEQTLVKQLPIAGLHGTPMSFDSFLQLAQREAHTIDAHRRALWEQRGDNL